VLKRVDAKGGITQPLAWGSAARKPSAAREPAGQPGIADPKQLPQISMLNVERVGPPSGGWGRVGARGCPVAPPWQDANLLLTLEKRHFPLINTPKQPGAWPRLPAWRGGLSPPRRRLNQQGCGTTGGRGAPARRNMLKARLHRDMPTSRGILRSEGMPGFRRQGVMLLGARRIERGMWGVTGRRTAQSGMRRLRPIFRGLRARSARELHASDEQPKAESGSPERSGPPPGRPVSWRAACFAARSGHRCSRAALVLSPAVSCSPSNRLRERGSRIHRQAIPWLRLSSTAA